MAFPLRSVEGGSFSCGGFCYKPLVGGGPTYAEQLADIPTATSQHGFEELNGLLYAVAGEDGTGEINRVYAYNPADNSWTQKADYPISAQSLCLRAVNGKLYGIGGYSNDAGLAFQDVYEYDPGANTWTQKADMPTAREDMGSAVVNNLIYVFGGLGPPGTPTKVLEIYNPATNQWTTGADMPDYKHFGDHGCAYDGKVYSIGASNTFADYPTLHNVPTVYEYDPATDQWSTKAEIPVSTSYKGVVVFGSKLYVVSGATTNSSTYTAAIYAYDPADNTWELAGQAPYAAGGIGLVTYNNIIYMCGGWNTGAKTNLYKLR